MATLNVVYKIGADISSMQRDMSRAATSTEKLQRGFSMLGKALIAAGVASGVAAIGRAAVKSAADFESSFAGVRKTVDATEEEFAELAQGMRDLSKEIPINVNELNRIGEAAGQLGIETDNILEFTRVMADLGVTTNLSSDQAATSLARLANITQMPQSAFENLGSTIVGLGNQFATTEAEITDFALRIAGAGQIAGLTEDEILAIGTAMSSVGVQAEAGGTSVQKVLNTMTEAVSLGTEELGVFAATAGMSSQQFAAAFRDDAAGAFETFVTGLGQQGNQAFGTLDQLGLSNERVKRAFLSLAGAGDLLSRALDVGSEEWRKNTALAEEAEKRYETFQSQVQLLKNVINDLSISAGTQLLPALKDIVVELQGWLRDVGESGRLTALMADAVTLLKDAYEGLTPILQRAMDIVSGYITSLASASLAQDLFEESAGGSIDATEILVSALGEGSEAWKAFKLELALGATASVAAASAMEKLTEEEQAQIGVIQRLRRDAEGLLPPIEGIGVEAEDASSAMAAFEREAKKTGQTVTTLPLPITEVNKNLKIMQGLMIKGTKEAVAQGNAWERDFFTRVAEGSDRMTQRILENTERSTALQREANMLRDQMMMTSLDFQNEQIRQWGIEQENALDRTAGTWEEDMANIAEMVRIKMLLAAKDYQAALDAMEAATVTFMDRVQGFFNNLGHVIIGAFQGGGNIGQAVGASIGQFLGKEIATHLGASLGFIAGPIGAIAGSFISKGINALFGPSERELAARAGRLAADEFMQGVIDGVDPAKVDEIYDLLGPTGVFNRDREVFQAGLEQMFIDVGMSAERAGIQAEIFWSKLIGAAERGPEAVALVVEEIQDMLAEYQAIIDTTKKIEETQISLLDVVIERNELLKEVLAEGAEAWGAFLDSTLTASEHIPDVFRPILEAQRLVAGEFGPLIKGAEAAATAIANLATLGALTGKEFSIAGAGIKSAFNQMLASGASTESILEAMRIPISTLIRLQDEFGFKVDAGTQSIIDQGRAYGITGEESVTAADKQLEALNLIIQALVTMLEFLGADIPEALRNLPDASVKIRVDASEIADFQQGLGIEPVSLFGSPGVPGFARGSGGIRDFGDGSLAMLHGREGVFTESQIAGLQSNNRELENEVRGLREDIRRSNTDLPLAIFRASRDGALLRV